MLAAIVFTDVVGFSKLASQNEARVYVALQRDMGVMTNLCRAHGGQVLNTMGDGMLLCFASAVDAMSCATEIQRTLYNQSHTLPSVDVLHHRIGVHLGDVIMNGDNVFGDGVNVAARLQSIARSDAVCFSHTVHEVIKNKLKIDATYLGPRQLKNLGEPVRVWQIPPIGETAPPPLDSVPTAPEIIQRGEELNTGAGGAKGAFLLVGALLLLGILGFAISRLKKPPPLTAPIKPAKSVGVAGVTPPNSAGDTGTGGDSTVPVLPSHTNADAIRREIEGYRESYDFEKIVDVLNRQGNFVPDLLAKRGHYAQLAQMRVFLDHQLAMTSGTTTVEVNFADRGPTQVHVSGNVVYIDSASRGAEQMPWPPKPEILLPIISALCAHPVDGSTPPAEGSLWEQDFSSEYSGSSTTDSPVP